MDNNCAYGYTLLGHEYVAIEELDRALKCFRTAIRIYPRHYNAWYGLGMIYYKQERYQRAENYYKKALSIHPNNSVLLCHLGVVSYDIILCIYSICCNVMCINIDLVCLLLLPGPTCFEQTREIFVFIWSWSQRESV